MKISNVFWFTGLSGAGKSTVAEGVKSRLNLIGMKVLIIDGDIIRDKITKNLVFNSLIGHCFN